MFLVERQQIRGVIVVRQHRDRGVRQADTEIPEAGDQIMSLADILMIEGGKLVGFAGYLVKSERS